jgi:5-methylthioadenosine/S-adenosylhomocysteine deaminase
MKITALLHKVSRLKPTILPAETVLKMATINGGRALGYGNKLGTLTAGAFADLISIDLDQPHLTPFYHPESHLVYATKASDVTNVIINGRVVMKNKEITTLDQDKILANCQNYEFAPR